MPQHVNRGALCVAITPCLQRTLTLARLDVGAVNRVKSVALSPGGKTVNVARTLRALGTHPTLTGFCGGDTGRTMTGFLHAMQIRTDFVSTEAGTRICSSLVEAGTGIVTEIVEEAPQPSASEWRELQQRLDALLPGSALVMLSGAPPPGSREGVYRDISRAARERGLSMVIDAQGPPLLETLAQQPTLVKLNAQELAATRSIHPGDQRALLEAARSLCVEGAGWVLVTRGADPAWLLNRDGAWIISPPVVAAVNPVGSGDATAGGIACGLQNQEPMLQSVCLGMACGAANAMTLTPGDVDAKQTAELRNKVLVSEMGT